MSLTKTFIKYAVKNFVYNTIVNNTPYLANIISPTQIVAIATLSKLGLDMKVIAIILLFI